MIWMYIFLNDHNVTILKNARVEMARYLRTITFIFGVSSSFAYADKMNIRSEDDLIIMPNLVRSTLNDAKEVLESIGLNYEITSVRHCESGPRTIINHYPPAGTRLKSLSSYVFLREAAAGQPMPDFRGKVSMTNLPTLAGHRVSVSENAPLPLSKEVKQACWNDRTASTIVSSVPEPGARVCADDEIKLKIQHSYSVQCMQICGELPC